MKRLHQIFKGGAMSSLAILLLLSCFSISQINGQNCGWDSHYGQQLKDPVFLKHMKELINRTDQQAKTLNGETDLTEVEIPIVFHIVHKNTAVGSGDNFNYADIEDAWMRLNADFSGSGISFCLAQRDEAGNQLDEPGVVRVDASGNSQYMSSGITMGTQVEFDVKALGPQFNNYNYLNVWVVSNILGIGVNGQIQGVGYFPNTVNAAIDGIMIRSSIFNDATNRVITHEAGHYLGLFHTFTGDDPDYDGANFICPADADFPLGDGIADTQPHIRSASGSCPSGPNGCPTGGMLEDISNNHMDYSGESCRNNFTANQIAKMLETVDCHRKGLIHSLGCALGCDPVFAVDYTHSPTNPFANDSDDPMNEPGDNVIFSNTSNSTSYEWYVDGVLQTTINTDLTFVFQTAGDHIVCLVETDVDCTIETCKTIRVFSQGTCQDMTLAPCELLLNGDFTQFNEDEALYNMDGTPFQNQFIDYLPYTTNFTNKVCNWVNKGGTPTIGVLDNDEIVFYLGAFLTNETNGPNSDIISTIFPLDFIHGQQYEISLQWKPMKPSNGSFWGTKTVFNVGLSNNPFDFDDRNEIHSTDEQALILSNITDITGYTDLSFIFTYDENNGNFLCFWGDEFDGGAINFVKNISVNSCNVCDAEPSYTYTNECGSFSFDGVDGNPNSNGIISWSIDGITLPETEGQEDFDFNFPYEDHYEVCMNITCPYGGTVQYCETVFAGGVTSQGIACEICQNPETINVTAQRCGEDSNEFLVESFSFSVPKGFKPCLDDFGLIQGQNGTVITNDYFVDESDDFVDVFHVSFTFLAVDPSVQMSAILGLCGPNGETRCIQFVIESTTTCDTCEDAPQYVTNIEVACDDDNLSDGVQKYSGSYTVNLGTTDVVFCGATSNNSGFSTQMTSVGIDGTFDFDFNICTNQEGAFNVPVTLCFIDDSGKEPKKRCFKFIISVDDPCITDTECEIVGIQTPISCENVKEGVANFLLQSSHSGQSLIEQGYVFCEDNPITGEYITVPPITSVGITSYLFSVELAIPCEEVANVGSTTITLNLCHPNGETYCYELEYDLECDECDTPCDETVEPVTLKCKSIEDGKAKFDIGYGYANSTLIEQGYVYCDPTPLSGEYLTDIYLIHITQNEYTFGTTFFVPCEELENGVETSITMHLCDENGNTFCVEIPVILECDDCVETCDETLSPITLECNRIKDGAAEYNFSMSYTNTSLQQQGYVFCNPDGVIGNHIVGQPFTNVGINAFIFGVNLEMSCAEVAAGGETSITINLCDENGNTYCVEIPIILECKDCDTENGGGKLNSRSDFENDYKVYPNPSNGNVYIDAPSSIFEQSYKIYDVSGKAILTGKLSEGNNFIDLRNNLNGLYYIQIKNGTNLYQQKIVIVE